MKQSTDKEIQEQYKHLLDELIKLRDLMDICLYKIVNFTYDYPEYDDIYLKDLCKMRKTSKSYKQLKEVVDKMKEEVDKNETVQ